VFETDLGYSPARLLEARITGVSQETADALAKLDLRRERVPIRAYGRPGEDSRLARIPITITRDDAGRIRVDGDLAWLARWAGRTTEPNRDGGAVDLRDDAIAGARRVVDEQLLAAPLGAIRSDDATGRKR
jgi:hypothetical protein